MMRDPIEYFLSAEITLSDKLLEVLYLIIGLICIYTAIANLRAVDPVFIYRHPDVRYGRSADPASGQPRHTA